MDLMGSWKTLAQLASVCAFLERAGLEVLFEPPLIGGLAENNEAESDNGEGVSAISPPRAGRHRALSDVDFSGASPLQYGGDSIAVLLRRRDELAFAFSPIACKELAAQWRFATHTIRHFYTSRAKRTTAAADPTRK